MDQQEAIWEGQLIDDREDKEYKILLYQIGRVLCRGVLS
jgi:hypothetical protein